MRNAMEFDLDRSREILVRTPLEGKSEDYQRFGLAPDGWSFVVYNHAKPDVTVYELRGAVPAGRAASPPSRTVVATGPPWS